MVRPIDFESLFGQIRSPSMMLDRQLRHAAANRADLEIVGHLWDELKGVQIFGTFPAGGESRKMLENSPLRARQARSTFRP